MSASPMNGAHANHRPTHRQRVSIASRALLVENNPYHQACLKDSGDLAEQGTDAPARDRLSGGLRDTGCMLGFGGVEASPWSEGRVRRRTGLPCQRRRRPEVKI